MIFKRKKQKKSTLKLINGTERVQHSGYNPPKIYIPQRYTITGRIGNGACGEIYLATDNESGKDVAIKIYNPTEEQKAKIKHRGLSEEEASKKDFKGIIHGKYLMPTYLEENNGSPFIVMPYVPTFLSDILQDDKERRSLGNGLDLEKILIYSSGIYQGILEGRRKYSATHCDLKPENIAIDDGEPLIADWGIATVIGEKNNPRDNMGEMRVRSPRLFLAGQNPSYNSDLFSLGSMIYRMITEKYIFEDELNETSRISSSNGELSRNFASKFLKRGTSELNPKKVSKLIDKKLKAIKLTDLSELPKNDYNISIQTLKLLLTADLEENGYKAERKFKKRFIGEIARPECGLVNIFTYPEISITQMHLKKHLNAIFNISTSYLCIGIAGISGIIGYGLGRIEEFNNPSKQNNPSKIERMVDPKDKETQDLENITKWLKELREKSLEIQHIIR